MSQDSNEAPKTPSRVSLTNLFMLITDRHSFLALDPAFGVELSGFPTLDGGYMYTFTCYGYSDADDNDVVKTNAVRIGSSDMEDLTSIHLNIETSLKHLLQFAQTGDWYQPEGFIVGTTLDEVLGAYSLQVFKQL